MNDMIKVVTFSESRFNQLSMDSVLQVTGDYFSCSKIILEFFFVNIDMSVDVIVYQINTQRPLSSGSMFRCTINEK